MYAGEHLLASIGASSQFLFWRYCTNVLIIFQVHKEPIDKVPNALSNRSNIEIEIYGMEGIPEEDLKEHEKQKQGGSKGDFQFICSQMRGLC